MWQVSGSEDYDNPASMDTTLIHPAVLLNISCVGVSVDIDMYPSLNIRLHPDDKQKLQSHQERYKMYMFYMPVVYVTCNDIRLITG